MDVGLYMSSDLTAANVGQCKHNLPAQALSHERASLNVAFYPSLYHVTYPHKA